MTAPSASALGIVRGGSRELAASQVVGGVDVGDVLGGQILAVVADLSLADLERLRIVAASGAQHRRPEAVLGFGLPQVLESAKLDGRSDGRRRNVGAEERKHLRQHASGI